MKEETLVKFLSRESKRQMVEQLDQSTTKSIALTCLALSFVNEIMLNEVRNNPDYIKIYKLLEQSKEKGSLEEEIVNEYSRRLDNVIERINNEIVDVERQILGKKYENIKKILEGSKENKEQICQEIYDNCMKNPANANMKSKLDLLNSILFDLRHPTFKPCNELLKAEIKDGNILEIFAYVIFKPEIFYLELRKLDSAWDTFPLRWFLDDIEISLGITLFEAHKKGDDVSRYFEIRYSSDAIDSLINLVKKHHFIEIEQRQLILEEIIESYKQGKYASVIYGVLPIIEGVLWCFSERFNNKYRNIYKNCGDKKILKLKNGKEIEGPTIGELLKLSAFGDNFDLDFIEYFCNELYKERNPILHGDDINFANKLNASKKLATFEYVMKRINGIVENILIETYGSMLSETVKEKLLRGEDLIEEDFVSMGIK